MTDCPNGDIRDLLPDYVHGRLGAAERAEVAAHVDSCACCAAEVELLGAAQRVLNAATPSVDTARIVAALPAPPRAVPRPAMVREGQYARRRPWRIAAAIATVAIGGISFAVIRGITGGGTQTPVSGNTAPVVQPAKTPQVVSQPAQPQVAVKPSQPHVAAPPPEEVADNTIAIPDGGRLGDLSDEDVQSLLNDIDAMDGVPDANPQPTVPVIRGAGTL
jgi:anti-sigma factor RsiW